MDTKPLDYASMSGRIEDKIMSWAHAHGITLNIKNVEPQSFEESLTYIKLPPNNNPIIIIKCKDIATYPASLILKSLSFFGSRHGISITHHFAKLMTDNFTSKIFWIKKAMYININLFTPSFMNFLHTSIIQSKNLPIESKFMQILPSLSKHHSVDFSCDLIFNTQSNGDILYIPNYKYQLLSDFNSEFSTYGSQIVESIHIPCQHIEKNAKLLLKFKIPSNIKKNLLYDIMDGNHKYMWVNEQIYQQHKNELSQQQGNPSSPIISTLKQLYGEESKYDVEISLDEYKRSICVRTRGYYFEAILSLIKSNVIKEIIIGLVQMRKDMEEFAVEGTLKTYIPNKMINEVSNLTISLLENKNKYEFDYEQYSQRFCNMMSEPMKLAMNNMRETLNNQFLVAIIELLVQLNDYFTKYHKQYTSFEILLNYLSSSNDVNDKCIFLRIMEKINDKSLAEKYLSNIINLLCDSSEYSLDIQLIAINTIKLFCLNGYCDRDENIVFKVLSSISYKALNDVTQCQELGDTLLEFLIIFERSHINTSMYIFVDIFKYVIEKKEFIVAHPIWLELCIKLEASKHNNKINRGIIGNCIKDLCIQHTFISDDENKKLYDYGVHLLAILFSNHRVDVSKFMESIVFRSTSNLISMISALLDTEVKSCVDFIVMNLKDHNNVNDNNNNILQRIINYILNVNTNNHNKCNALNVLGQICFKLESIIHNYDEDLVVPIVKDIIQMTLLLLKQNEEWISENDMIDDDDDDDDDMNDKTQPENIENDNIKFSCLNLLHRCIFIDIHDEILCNNKEFNILIDWLHNRLKLNDECYDTILKVISSILHVYDAKYSKFEDLMIILQGIYQNDKSKRVIECISYAIGANPSITEEHTMKIANQILSDHKDKTSQFLLSLMHSVALKISYDKFEPMLKVLIPELLQPLNLWFNAKYYNYTNTLLATEFEQIEKNLYYVHAFLKQFGKQMNMQLSNDIIQLFKNILHINYSNDISSDIKCAIYDIMDTLIESKQTRKSFVKKIFDMCVNQIKNVKENDEFIILSKILEFIKNISIAERLYTSKIGNIITKKAKELKNDCDDVKSDTVTKKPLFPLGSIAEETENDLFEEDMFEVGYYNQYQCTYGPVLDIYKKMQEYKRRKAMSPIFDDDK